LAVRRGVALEELSLADMQEAEPVIGADVFSALELDTVVDARKSYGGTARARVLEQVAAANANLEAIKPLAPTNHVEEQG